MNNLEHVVRESPNLIASIVAMYSDCARCDYANICAQKSPSIYNENIKVTSKNISYSSSKCIEGNYRWLISDSEEPSDPNSDGLHDWVVNTDYVLTTYPPQYGCKCSKCGEVAYKPCYGDLPPREGCPL